MKYFDPEGYEKFLLVNNVIGFYENPVVQSSGQMTHWYANFGKLYEEATLVEIAGRFIYNFSKEKDLNQTIFLGVPNGAIEFGTAANRYMSYATAKPVPVTFLRGKEKLHGIESDTLFVGSVPESMRPAIVEDALSTGKKVEKVIQLLIREKKPPVAVIAMLYRQERRSDGKIPEQIFQEYNVPFYPMTTAQRIIHQAIERLPQSQEILEKLRLELMDMSKYHVPISIC